MRVHVTVSEMKARRENGNDDAHIIWLRSAYCSYLLSITHTHTELTIYFLLRTTMMPTSP